MNNIKSIWTGVVLVLILTGASTSKTGMAVTSPEPAYAAQRLLIDGVVVVRLRDSAREIEVSILPSMGNRAYEMKIHGKNILYFPEMSLSDFQKNPAQNGIPFLAPWANRLDGNGFWANGRRYEFDSALNTFRKDNRGLPIHGLLVNSALWQVIDIGADAHSAHVTCKLQFWKYPELMAQWPFAHEYEMSYRLSDGGLEVQTAVSNLSAEAMPLALGFHPYYRIPDVPRDQWVLHMSAGKAVIADERSIPTGEFRTPDLPNPLPLKGRTLDDGFTDFERDSAGRAKFIIESAGKQIELLFGPKYPVAVIWEPASPPGQTRDFICVEPMTGITNAINLNQAGKYPGLQVVPAGGKWTDSFWIHPRGF
jgi:aldose 1-epimerase